MNIDELDLEVAAVADKIKGGKLKVDLSGMKQPPAGNMVTARKPNFEANTKKMELGDGVDFGAAGVTDLNNFKGYHNQANKAEEIAQRYTCPISGAHFEFHDISVRMHNIVKNRE